MGDGMNCGYVCSFIGILKILTVLLTAVPIALMFIAISDAEYYKSEDSEGGCKKVTVVISGFMSQAKTEKKLKPCPAKALGFTALSIFAICFVVSLVCLIVLLIVKLNENGIFKQLDYIYHLAGGICVIVGAILAICFGALALNWYPDCEKAFLKDVCEKYRKKAFELEFQLAAGGIGFVAGVVRWSTYLLH